MKFIKTHVLSVLLLASALYGVVALADESTHVQQKLQGFEWQLVAGQWQSAEDQAELAAIALSKAEPPFIRARALRVLTLFANDESVRVYAHIIGSNDSSLRRRAVDCLCELDVDSSELLRPLLDSEDKHLVVRAAKCLTSKYMQVPEVSEALARFADRADDWQVKSSGLEASGL